METKTTTTEEKLELAKTAIHHTLCAIANDPAKYYLIGPGTGTWDHLTKAAAAIYGKSQEEVSKEFRPREREYNRYCEEKEANEELVRYCRDNNITVPKD